MRTQLAFRAAAMADMIASATIALGGRPGHLRVHDPSRIIKEGDRHYLFYTANGVRFKYSNDLLD